MKPVPAWPVLIIALPAAVAVWAGWVGLGQLCGFGVVHPLPGTPWADVSLDTAITLPVGVEAYGVYALRVWLRPGIPDRARRFAGWSAAGSLVVGGTGQVGFHLMTARGYVTAPWPVVTVVSVLPVAVLGMAAALAHMLHDAPVGRGKTTASPARILADRLVERLTATGRHHPDRPVTTDQAQPVTDQPTAPAKRPAQAKATSRSTSKTTAATTGRDEVTDRRTVHTEFLATVGTDREMTATDIRDRLDISGDAARSMRNRWLRDMEKTA